MGRLTRTSFKLLDDHPTIGEAFKLVRNPRIIPLEFLIAFWILPAAGSSIFSPDQKNQTASALASALDSGLRGLIANPWAQLGYFAVAFYGVFWAAKDISEQNQRNREAAERESADIVNKQLNVVLHHATFIPNLIARSWGLKNESEDLRSIAKELREINDKFNEHLIRDQYRDKILVGPNNIMDEIIFKNLLSCANHAKSFLNNEEKLPTYHLPEAVWQLDDTQRQNFIASLNKDYFDGRKSFIIYCDALQELIEERAKEIDQERQEVDATIRNYRPK